MSAVNTMTLYIEKCLKEFVKKRDDIFGFKSAFVGFECDQIDAEKGLQSDNISGCIRYTTKIGDYLQSPPLFLKSIPAISLVKEAVFFQYANESFFYSHMLPYFVQLETSVSEYFPEFYTSFIQTSPQLNEGVIILENLSHAQYKNAPLNSFLDYSHLSLMMRSLGRFHAYSYLAKELDPLHFQARAFPLNPIHFNLIGQCPGFLTRIGSRGLNRLAQQCEYKSLVAGIQDLLDNGDQILMNVFKNEKFNPWAVVCHGDYTSGNVMFKYEKGHPVSMKMVDFAMSTYSSPVLDLALLLYMNASQETRDLHWDRLLDDYFSGLYSLPIKVAKLPTMDDIMKEFHSKAFYAYLLASIFQPFVISGHLASATLHHFFPPEFRHCCSLVEVPHEVQCDVALIIGGEEVTESLADILKDMLKRGFI